MDIPTAPISPIALPAVQPQLDNLNTARAERFKRGTDAGAGGSA